MALITCPECGGQVSDLAVACPHCGFPIQPSPASGGCSVVLMDVKPHPDQTLSALHLGGLSDGEVADCLASQPCVPWRGLTLEGAYRKADLFENCGLVKVIADRHTDSPKELNSAPPVPRPQSGDKPLTFGAAVGAVVLGLLIWSFITLILSALF